jgi:hypothetical protein
MDDTSLLREIIQRCTAILVASISITGITLQRDVESGILIFIAIGSILYLAIEFLTMTPTIDDTNHNADSE